MIDDPRLAAEAMVRWLDKRILRAGRGDDDETLEVQPSGRYFLGRLAPEDRAVKTTWGDRADRLEPCGVGLRARPSGLAPWCVKATVAARAWIKSGRGAGASWRKGPRVTATVTAVVQPNEGEEQQFGFEGFRPAMAAATGTDGYDVRLVVTYERAVTGEPELTILAVNTSPDDDRLIDPILYQVELELHDLPTVPYELESLPDSFRYDRRVPAYGINCSVEPRPGAGFRVADTSVVERSRPVYWSMLEPPPDLSFATLARDPLPALRALASAHRRWGTSEWSPDRMARRARDESWTASMKREAADGAAAFEEEASRLDRGVALLVDRADLLQAFRLMNDAMGRSSKHPYWRPFQVGFILATLVTFVDETDQEFVDVLWFPTGGGKTETYLGLLVLGAFFDRLIGKKSGLSAWTRFPLRLLSLQQTQRFADTLAGAELVRREQRIGGAPFSLGFFVGKESTPNRISLEPREGEPDPDDESMPTRYQVLLRCPFCAGSVAMGFDRATWRLEHRCVSGKCPWPERGLPFYVVDDEIYRFLPTVLVGTLDKVALIAMQASSRGLVAAPNGVCSEKRHGYVYASRNDYPNGCLVPGCKGKVMPLPMEEGLYPPRFRLQDELHLLRDSLGAVDAYYESLLDALAAETTHHRAKIVASSATLAGYERQVAVLYSRRARVFPALGPTSASSFWATDGEAVLRRFVAIAPRGATLEYAVDRIVTILQQSIRMLMDRPADVSLEIGIDHSLVPEMVSLFGANVIYGNTIRDLDAVARSLDTQVPVEPLKTAHLTGHTSFEDVRRILQRLEKPEVEFGERLHVVTASQMMSHGVDIDRLNCMVMLGAPLGTAEFIQATARIGRKWPGLVLMLHKMGRERDASIYRSFAQFVAQGDRFVEPIPITRRSRRVLLKALPGIENARLVHIHEPASGTRLTKVKALRDYFRAHGIEDTDETEWINTFLRHDGVLDLRLRREVELWMRLYFRNLRDPGGQYTFPNQLGPNGPPMRSLRDVEDAVPVRD